MTSPTEPLREALDFAETDALLRDDVRRLGAMVGEMLAEQVSPAFPRWHLALHRHRGVEDRPCRPAPAREGGCLRRRRVRLPRAPLMGIAEAGEPPTERKLALFHGECNGSVDPVFREFGY
jgi:hypothetical protein